MICEIRRNSLNRSFQITSNDIVRIVPGISFNQNRSVQITSNDQVRIVPGITFNQNITENITIQIIIRSDITWHVHVEK